MKKIASWTSWSMAVIYAFGHLTIGGGDPAFILIMFWMWYSLIKAQESNSEE